MDCQELTDAELARVLAQCEAVELRERADELRAGRRATWVERAVLADDELAEHGHDAASLELLGIDPETAEHVWHCTEHADGTVTRELHTRTRRTAREFAQDTSRVPLPPAGQERFRPPGPAVCRLVRRRPVVRVCRVRRRSPGRRVRARSPGRRRSDDPSPHPRDVAALPGVLA